MKIPKYIRDSMRKCVEYNRKSAYEMCKVEYWLEQHEIDQDTLRDGNGCSLEELEYGNDIVDELCERIEGILCNME